MDEGAMAPSQARGSDAVPLLEETIGTNLERTIARFGDRDALISCQQGRRYSYRELGAAVDLLARALIAAGLEPGDRLGVWSPNCAEWVLVQYATAKAGVIMVNINPAYRTSELEYALRQSGCKMLIAARAFKSSDYVSMLSEVRPGLPELELVVILDSEGWGELLAGAEAVDQSQLESISRALAADDPINIQYTSGTTGFPKGATLTHRNILNNGFFVGEGCRYTEADRVCIPVPFYHCFGMVLGNLACTTHGSAIVIPAPAFEPGATLAAVATERCTSLYGVPTMFIAMLGADDFDSYDLAVAADRNHGRLAVPGRGHEARDRADAHERGRDRVRDDGDLAGLDADGIRRSDREAGRHRRSGPSSCRDQGRRSGDGRRGRARCQRRAVHARLQRDERLLERPGADRARRSTPTVGCTPATWRRWTRTVTSTSSGGSRTW